MPQNLSKQDKAVKSFIYVALFLGILILWFIAYQLAVSKKAPQKPVAPIINTEHVTGGVTTWELATAVEKQIKSSTGTITTGDSHFKIETPQSWLTVEGEAIEIEVSKEDDVKAILNAAKASNPESKWVDPDVDHPASIKDS